MFLNFMPTISRTRTISEGLRALYERLMEGRAELESESRKQT
jgi:hypothetical protein